MSFELILVLLTAITGAIAYVDKVAWAPKRARSVTTESEPVIVEYSKSLFPVFLIVLVLRSFIAEPFRIPSGSMYPTLQVGDFIIVNKFAYGLKLPVTQTKILPLGEPERGDVIVFKYPVDPEIDFIKRVIGLPGDEISYVGRTVFVNGKAVSQAIKGPYYGKNSGAQYQGMNVFEELAVREGGKTHAYQVMTDTDKSSRDLMNVKVPEGHYFVMGDNRDYSNDSRVWGFVPEENIKGYAFGIWMSWDDGIQFDRLFNGID